MKFTAKIILLTTIITCLQSCATKQGSGTAIGGLGGALAGSAFGKGEGRLIGASIGALAGAFIGNRIGKSMDERDKRILAETSQKALEVTPSGTKVEWINPDSGHHGYVTPIKTYRDEVGRNCREYTQMIFIGGEEEEVVGKACRSNNGYWEIVR